MLRFAKTMMAALAIALAMLAMPGKAEAGSGWVWPAVIVGGLAIWAISAHHAQAHRVVYQRPRAKCRIVRERTSSGYRRVEVCN